MGLWTDGARNVYAAVYGTGEVKRVAPDGRVTVVARSTLPWSPTGGMIGPDGSLWILEYSITNAVRMRRIDRSGRVTVF
jgi:sugar lactone lactonase YvrE